MRCPMCQKRNTRVDLTRIGKDEQGDDFIKRKRICREPGCGHKFDTYETYELADIEAAFKLSEVHGICHGDNKRIVAPYPDAYPFTPA